MNRYAVSVFLMALFAILSWSGSDAQARSCSDAYKQCKNFCASSGNTESCPNLCKSRFNSCKRTGTFIWTTKPLETGLVRK